MLASDELGWREIAERAVRPDRVGVLPPGLDEAPRRLEGREPMLVQAFITQPPIEALHVGVLHRLAGVDEVQLDPAPVGLGIQGTPRELWPVIDRDEPGPVAHVGEARQDLDDPSTRQGRIGDHRRSLS